MPVFSTSLALPALNAPRVHAITARLAQLQATFELPPSQGLATTATISWLQQLAVSQQQVEDTQVPSPRAVLTASLLARSQKADTVRLSPPTAKGAPPSVDLAGGEAKSAGAAASSEAPLRDGAVPPVPAATARAAGPPRTPERPALVPGSPSARSAGAASGAGRGKARRTAP